MATNFVLINYFRYCRIRARKNILVNRNLSGNENSDAVVVLMT